MIICEDMDILPLTRVMFHVAPPRLAKHYGTFLLCHSRLDSASENTQFGGPSEGLDDHYPSIPKRNGTPCPQRPRAKQRGKGQVPGPRCNVCGTVLRLLISLPLQPQQDWSQCVRMCCVSVEDYVSYDSKHLICGTFIKNRGGVYPHR